MGFFTKAKKVVKGVVDEALMELDNQPELYRAVQRLSNELKSLNKTRFSKEINSAAEQLNARLVEAMRVIDNPAQKAITVINYKIAFQAFAEECHSAIHAYQPTLMSAPGFWNQIAASINNFLEEYLNIAPIFKTEMSELALQASFRERFNKVKEELQPEESDEEEVCCFKMN